MKVLVLMATYNGAKFLREQINSILDQKGVEVEILIRDDGSADTTQDILKEYKKRGLIRWYTGNHMNVQKGYFNLMKVARKYKADFFAFCDQDDVWDEDKLSIAVRALDKHERSKGLLYYSGQRLVDENLDLLSEHYLNSKRNMFSRFILSDIAGCTAVFNRVLLEQVIEYNPDYCLMHDSWLLKVCLALGGDAIVDPVPHINYRQHGNNTVGLGNSFLAQLKRVKQYVFEYKIEKQMKELRNGYSNKMVSEYRILTEQICEYRKNFRIKLWFLNLHNINFKNWKLNLTYLLKVLLNRL